MFAWNPPDPTDPFDADANAVAAYETDDCPRWQTTVEDAENQELPF